MCNEVVNFLNTFIYIFWFAKELVELGGGDEIFCKVGVYALAEGGFSGEGDHPVCGAGKLMINLVPDDLDEEDGDGARLFILLWERGCGSTRAIVVRQGVHYLSVLSALSEELGRGGGDGWIHGCCRNFNIR